LDINLTELFQLIGKEELLNMHEISSDGEYQSYACLFEATKAKPEPDNVPTHKSRYELKLEYCLCVCVCVCVREREREREGGEGGREGGREKDIP
jgi:hypothetical protein